MIAGGEKKICHHWRRIVGEKIKGEEKSLKLVNSAGKKQTAICGSRHSEKSLRKYAEKAKNRQSCAWSEKIWFGEGTAILEETERSDGDWQKWNTWVRWSIEQDL